MSEDYVEVAGLSVAEALFRFVEDEALPARTSSPGCSGAASPNC